MSIASLVNVKAQTNQSQKESFDDLPNVYACEEWIGRISEAFNKWSKNENSSFIVIARLGNRETSSRINLKRIKTLKEYIASFDTKVNAVFAQGERVPGNSSLIELYVEGKLIDSLRVPTKSDIPLKGCNP